MASGFTVDEVDFEAFYQGKSPVEGVEVPFGRVPWDIGEPQPAVVAAADAGQLRGAVLDAGSGTGDNAIFLADRGIAVTGVDGSETAVATARRRAEERGADIDFVHADVTTMDGVPGPFDTVLDSALYHCLDQEERSAYSAALHRVTAPDAELHVFCFADRGEGFRMADSMTVSPADLREHLGAHWDVREIAETEYTTAFTVEELERTGLEALHQAGMTVNPEVASTDERGRIRGRMWHLRAVRR
ncbi:class I SAM-dependent methyltransferase [Salinifilum aidingensis]